MRARNKLNVQQVKNQTKPGIYSDGGGLYLRVRDSGKSWVYVYMLGGKRREMGLGSFLDVTLAQARAKAETARAVYLQRRDPKVERDRALVVEKPKPTFGAFALEMLDEIEEGHRNAKHRQQWRNTLKTYAASLWEMPIDEVATEHVLGALQPIWLSKSETASRVRQRIERVLDAAKAKGLRTGDNPARGRGHLDLLLPKRQKSDVRHHAALPFAQISTFMAELRERTAVSALALEFLILTAARSGEVRGAKWSEIDLAAGLWTIPRERMKAGVEHVVPLSETALKILRDVRPQNPRPERRLFSSPRGLEFSDMALTVLLKRMGRVDITVHGFRSTFRDWAGDTTNFDREEVEMALAHTVRSATERAYRRGRAVEKRRALMSAWAQYCGLNTNVDRASDKPHDK